MWKKAALWISLLCYAIILTLILLVVRFPKETFIAYAIDTIEEKFPGFTITVDDVVYVYPLSLQINHLSLANQPESHDIAIDVMMLTFDRKSPGNRGRLQFGLYGGKVAIDVDLHRESDTIELPSIILSGIRLADVDPLKNRLGRSLEGTLDYSGRFAAKLDDLSTGVLRGSGKITGFQVDLKRPILQNDTVVFDSVAASAVLQKGILVLADGVATGPSYDGQFSGQLDFSGHWQEAAVTITGVLLPQEEYVMQNQQVARAVSLLYKKYGSREIPYSISGSFREPSFQFGEAVPDADKPLVQ